ncbi:MAG: hypothetical protein V3S21_09915 [Xanthomonadales bacterium]
MAAFHAGSFPFAANDHALAGGHGTLSEAIHEAALHVDKRVIHRVS